MIISMICLLIILPGCAQTNDASPAISSQPSQNHKQSIWSAHSEKYPKIASWLAKKDEIIASEKPYDLVMSAWFTPEEAALIKSQNPDAILLVGLSVNWVWDNQEWMDFLITIVNYGRVTPLIINESMYLHRPDGSRCGFGWASEQWGHEEIYAMDPRNQEWVELITSFYETVLNQPQHDGIIIDMVTEKSWCPETISDQEWVEATRLIFQRIDEINTAKKTVVFNAGRDLPDIDAYSEFISGYLMENFMGEQVKSSFDDGLKAAEGNYIVIYAVDTDDTGIEDMHKMRLGLALSMMFDNTYFTYDFGPRDHGQAWWFPEYDVDLGNPLDNSYKKGDAYYREFEKGIVVASPYAATNVVFNGEFIDVSTGNKSHTFDIEKGDGRIFLRVN
ncbi:MAG: hypothetical protein A2Y89_03535 [Chloroflexi bacterium RBG_13_51_18]|nr:MAG: hypothetical protein A2Y89_03535 [Chloroflexi bacterium RBG_13_51_18]